MGAGDGACTESTAPELEASPPQMRSFRDQRRELKALTPEQRSARRREIMAKNNVRRAASRHQARARTAERKGTSAPRRAERQARSELKRAALREAGVSVHEPHGFLPINRSGCAWSGCASPMVAFPILMVLALPWVVT
jgi:hypothetical protein